MKGCPLRCAWCHNPEGLNPGPELMWYDARCIAARDCLNICPSGALELTPQGMQIDRQRCDACGLCAEACPAAALEVIGQTWTPAALFAEVQKDSIFYETSGGGVTLSGGEPMTQAGFVRKLGELCKGEGLHVALDTCGLVAWERLDAEHHQAATGVDNGRILDNARRIAAAGMPIWIRTPIIPGYTDGEGNIAGLGEFIAAELPTVERWDLLAYTNLGRPKYRRLERCYVLEDAPLLTRATMEALHAIAMEQVPVAVWSGATRKEAVTQHE